jgi:hypothetical protein
MSIIFTPNPIKRCGLYNILGELENDWMGFLQGSPLAYDEERLGSPIRPSFSHTFFIFLF